MQKEVYFARRCSRVKSSPKEQWKIINEVTGASHAKTAGVTEIVTSDGLIVDPDGVTYLGAVIDSSLSWKPHAENLNSRINSLIRGCFQIGKRSRNTATVFCRIRPMLLQPNAASCLKVNSPTTVTLISPKREEKSKGSSPKKSLYTFAHVFDENCGQKDVFDLVAKPLVEALIRGTNGVLFAYGVTGSGKTYTMTGVNRNPGIIPRCLQLLFNTIKDYQAPKSIFQQTKSNGYEISPNAGAIMKKQAEMNAKSNTTQG
ncbi:hypothetical protein DMENIID0001_060390 [Sergentomyia squamirostris]